LYRKRSRVGGCETGQANLRPVVRRDGVALRRIQLGEERVAVQHQPIVP